MSAGISPPPPLNSVQKSQEQNFLVQDPLPMMDTLETASIKKKICPYNFVPCLKDLKLVPGL